MADETYAVASEVHDLLVKTHPADTAKIEATKRLVIDHFDVDRLLQRIDAASSDSISLDGRTPMGSAVGALEPGSRSPVGRLGHRLAGLAASVRDRVGRG